MCCLQILSKHDVTAWAIWSPNGRNPGDSHKKYHKSGKIIDKGTLPVTAVSLEFALCGCPEKGSYPPSLGKGDNVGLTLVYWRCSLRRSGNFLKVGLGWAELLPASWTSIHIPNRWVKAERGWDREWWAWKWECRAGDDGRVAAPSAWVFHKKAGTGGKNNQRALVQLPGAFNPCGNKKKMQSF